MSKILSGGSTRVVVSVMFMLSLAGCGGLGLLPHESQMSSMDFQTYDQVAAAYTDIVPGQTRIQELEKLGFDTATAPNVEVLSYLGVIEKFMPRDTISFDHLALPVQACIEAQDRCSAYVFRPSRLEQHRTGSIFLDMMGFERTTVDRGWAAEVVLLMQDGRVAYKVMSGKPNIEGYHDDIQPLGPLQDLGGAVVHTASHFY